ncbi:transposase DNA-binding-containing protein [Horticoccus sp. 23ND18S-11]|uniref:transposase DNA-binding-containing protein n=1 Tax=Horticoccus sp. 23ND18S-11 TaxID=3391832 RepID=UPI0039C92E91
MFFRAPLGAQQELAGCGFRYERLGTRFSTVLRQPFIGTAESTPLACQNGAEARAANRFLSPERDSCSSRQRGHHLATLMVRNTRRR